MDPHTQQTIIDAVGKHGRDNLIVVLGTPSPEAAAIAAETVTIGDPTYAGPLAETRLGLTVYHILEEPIRATLDPAIYDQQVGLMAETLDAPAIAAAVAGARAAISSEGK
jgi:glycine reductase